MTGALVVLACFGGLVTCLETGLGVLASAALEMVDFDGLTLDMVGFEGVTLTEFALDIVGLDGVALEVVPLGLGVVFLAVVGCGFFGSTPRSDKAESGFVLEGLVLAVAGIVGFFLLSNSNVVLWELL